MHGLYVGVVPPPARARSVPVIGGRSEMSLVGILQAGPSRPTWASAAARPPGEPAYHGLGAGGVGAGATQPALTTTSLRSPEQDVREAVAMRGSQLRPAPGASRQAHAGSMLAGAAPCPPMYPVAPASRTFGDGGAVLGIECARGSPVCFRGLVMGRCQLSPRRRGQYLGQEPTCLFYLRS